MPFFPMVNHPVLLLAKKIELHYGPQIEKFWKTSTRKRAAKFYKLITVAKNDEQLNRSLLFKKLTGKTYSDKTDDLWRNEVRVLKAELERFIVETEHLARVKADENYNDWLLVHGFERLKFKEGIAEKSESISKNKEFSGDFQFALEIEFIQLLSYLRSETDMKKLMGSFTGMVQKWETTLAELIGQNLGKVNVLIAQYNAVSAEYQSPAIIKQFPSEYSRQLPDTNISKYYSHYSQSFTSGFEEKIEHYNRALQFINPIADLNPIFSERRIVLQISMARELSANGRFEEAHEIFSAIKKDIDRDFIEVKTIFYVNFVTNLVKCKRYAQALQILDEELAAGHALYQSMLLQNRLLCYLNLRDVKSLEGYISYDLDGAPFPQNYMLKLIKSAYFYLVKEYDLAAQLVTNLLQTKDAHNRMSLYLPISSLYKKFYSTASKNKGVKRWKKSDVALLVKEVEELESTAPSWMLQISVYVWLKGEIANIQAKSAM